MVLPVALITAGLSLLVGCIYIPTGERLIVGDRDYRAAVGDRDSTAPIRLGISTRSEVLKILGTPRIPRRDAGGDYKMWHRNANILAYEFTTVKGYWFEPLCFSAPEVREIYDLCLQFDEHDVLRSYWVESDWDYSYFPGYNGQNHQTQPLNQTGKFDPDVVK